MLTIIKQLVVPTKASGIACKIFGQLRQGAKVSEGRWWQPHSIQALTSLFIYRRLVRRAITLSGGKKMHVFEVSW